MKTTRQRLIILLVLVLAFVQLACSNTLSEMVSTEEERCRLDGGTWVKKVDIENDRTGYCDFPPTPGPPAAGDAQSDCYLPTSQYNWAYEEITEDTGTSGTTCQAWFSYKNSSDQPVILVVYTDFNNGAMHIQKWQTPPLKPGEEWRQQVSHTVYKDGVVTYSKVPRLLVIRDTPACAGLIPDSNQPMWEASAIILDELVCP